MAGYSLDWNDAVVKRRIEEALYVGLGNAGQVLHRRATDVVNVPYPPASRPGEPPHRRTRTLQRDLTVWLERVPGGAVMHMGWRRGRPDYAEYLAKGTRRMAARPALPEVWRTRGHDAIATVVEALRRALR